MENGVKNVHGLDRLLSDFFSQDDLGRLAADAGEILNCPLLVIDDTFHVVAHYTTPGFSDIPDSCSGLILFSLSNIYCSSIKTNIYLKR